MTDLQLFWTGLAALVAATLSNLGARSLREFSRHDLEEYCRRRGKPERFTEILQQHDPVALGVEILSVLLTVATATLGIVWALHTGRFALSDQTVSLIGGTLLLGLILVAATVWISRSIARVFSEEFIFHSWALWKGLAAGVLPLTWGANFLDVVLHRISGRERLEEDEERIEEEIRTIVTEGHRGGLLEEEAREMIEGVIDLGDADVAEIMTPRTDMNMLSIELTWDELLAETIETGHTRIPVYEKNRDDIIGILYSKDLLPELATGDPQSRTPVRDILRKPVFVPETKPVNDLLHMFQQLRTHIAVVLDEYGGVSGLVTIEDILEEIVGEIVDEYDEVVAEEIQQIDESTCEALGKTHVDEINQTLGVSLPEDGDFDTIGGFVFSELGHVPEPGESFVWQERVQIEVLEASRRRIERVLVHRLDDERATA